ncbi:ribosome maturation factor RimM [Campylobacter hyointestinalis]|uniref:ribosome maturation factor RimM n=1 Tax=Campylobacter hyointestinalis TaxID=198 RepID=UPI000CE532E1|nr:ribosome maturation factor RimM [Campylobacter hyointestinalis]PPB69154.1 16S rRNA processing protein RimM [Campylobacter hyointestinalis subsp. hyointestinalis]TWO21354.1 16S rRNA processing protein RimM [Campylobacter hyointestinalis]
MKSDFVEVCVLGKTVGLKGAMKLHNRSDFPEQFKKDAKFYDKKGKEFIIKSFDKTNSLVVFQNYEDIELAKSLVNTVLYRTIEDTKHFCKLKQDEFFYFDIIGCFVYEDDNLLGEILDIIEVGSGFLFSIQTAANLVSKGLSTQFYIPYLDNFIIDVNIDLKKIQVKNSIQILYNS